MSDPSFEDASRAAEFWLNTVALVAILGQRGAIDETFRLLLPIPDQPDWPCLQRSLSEHESTLRERFAELAVLSDGPVNWEGGLPAIVADPQHVYPHVWSSAHEAAHGLACLAIDLLVVPLKGITDPAEQQAVASETLSVRWKALAIPNAMVATLQERVCRERAKVLAPTPVAAKKPRGKNPKGGRPTKDEKPGDVKTLAALCLHHGYDNGSVVNYEPATNTKLHEQ